LIKDCLHSEDHPDCNLPYVDASLPTRLIDAGTSDGEPIRLINSKGLPLPTPYVALSHVWGTKRFLSTTSAALRDRKQSINLCDMPANFRDAILVIRVLGLRYIWIDSLCIVQDDKNDWQKEAQKMAHVYSSAYITLIPVSATSAHDGFLHQRKLKNCPAKISCIESKPEFDYFYADLPPDSYLIPAYDVQNSTWNRRGWTFQERLLSKRLLYFTTHQLFFECHRSCWMENNTPPELLRMVGNQPWSGVSTIIADVYSNPHAKIPDEWYLDWIEQYTERRFTKASDRLPALEGLASVVSDAVSDLYIHGLWAKDLARGLLWRLKNNKSAKLVDGVHTPTWSWARWQGAVRHETFIDFDGDVDTVPCFKLLSTDSSENGNAPRKPHCILSVEGKLAHVVGINDERSFPYKDGYSSHVWLDDASTTMEGRKTFAFLVSQTATFEPEGSQPTSTIPHCLLLEAVVGKANRYKRVGIMQLPDPAAESLGGEGVGVGEAQYGWDEKHIFQDSTLQVFELE
jgi:hypothetical protein